MTNGAWNSTPGFPGAPWAVPQPDAQRMPAWVDPARPQGYPVFNGFDQCLESTRRMLEGTVQISDLAPHIHPPFGARVLFGIRRVVVNVPAAWDPLANAAGLALAAANQIAPGSILTPTTAIPPFGKVLLTEHQTSPGHVAIFKSWGVTVQNSFPGAARITTDDQGPSSGSNPPNEFTSGSEYSEHQPTLSIVPDDKKITYFIENFDFFSPILVTFSVYGWQFPIRRYEESLRSLIQQPGYGVDCGAR